MLREGPGTFFWGYHCLLSTLSGSKLRGRDRAKGTVGKLTYEGKALHGGSHTADAAQTLPNFPQDLGWGWERERGGDMGERGSSQIFLPSFLPALQKAQACQGGRFLKEFLFLFF